MPKFLEVTDKTAARAAIDAANVDYLMANVREYGALGNGEDDDTEAITAAWAASGGALFFPPGTYLYNGPGFDGADLRVRGEGWNSNIILGSTSYLLKPSTMLSRLELRDLNITGGKGAVRCTDPGESTNAAKIISGCRFVEYTESAIAEEGDNSPNWWITENWFLGAEGNTTIGVALSPGLTDNCVIARNEFRRNRIHIKLGSGGNNAVIRDNDFLRNDAVNTAGPRVDVWIVPDTDTVNSGEGLRITNNRFGSEFLVPNDARILYADEGSGAYNALKFPVLNADSNGYIRGHGIFGNIFSGAADGKCPVIYSTTGRVWELAMRDNHVDLNTTYALQYRTASTTPDSNSSDNVFGPFYGYVGQASMGFPVSNRIAPGYTDDPNGVLQTRANVTRHHASGTSSSYQNLLTTALSAFTTSNAVITSATDAFGGSDAINLEFTGDGAVAYGNLLTCVPDKSAWVEMDVAQPDSGTACTAIKLTVVEGSNNTIHWTRVVQVPTNAQGWVTYAFPWTPRIAGTSPALFVQAETQSGAGSTGKVKVGRARVYHGNERQLGGSRPTVAAAATSVLTQRQLTNDIRNKLIASGLVSGTPYADPGTAVSIDLSSTTLTGTKAQFNTALSDADFATLAGTETLSGKTLSSPNLSAAKSNEYHPINHAFISWAYDPVIPQTAGAPGSGAVFLAAVPIPVSTTITNLHLNVAIAGSGLTADQCIAGLYQNGDLLESTGNQATAWQSTGLKTMALGSPTAVTAGIVHVAFVWNGSTGPQFWYSNGTPNINLANDELRGAYYGSGYTTTLPAELGTLIDFVAFWAAVS